MKKVNFNQLKNVSTPDEWIEKAIRIPEKNIKPAPFYLRPYTAVSAIAVVICCTVGMLVWANLGNNSKIPKTPANYPSASQSDSTRNLHNEIIESTENVTERQESSAIPPKTESQASETVPPEPTEPRTQTTAPDGDFTEPYNGLYRVYAVSDEPESDVTEPKYTAVENSSTSEYGDPCAGEVYFEGIVMLECAKNSRLYPESGIYCHIEDKDGFSVTEKFTSSELCTVSDCGDYFAAKYRPAEKLESGKYTVTFYDGYGNELKSKIPLGEINVMLKYGVS